MAIYTANVEMQCLVVTHSARVKAIPAGKEDGV
jgi:hypothetical protein